MSSKPKTQTQTTTSSPWEGQQPFLRDLFSQAQQAYRNDPGAVPMSDLTREGVNALAAHGRNNPMTALGQNFMSQVLGSTPQIGGVQDYINRSMRPSIGSQLPQGYGTFGYSNLQQPMPGSPGGGMPPMFGGIPGMQQGMPPMHGGMGPPQPQMGPQQQMGPPAPQQQMGPPSPQGQSRFAGPFQNMARGLLAANAIRR